MLTQECLRELLHYDPNTGIFSWRVARSNRVKIGDPTGCQKQCGAHLYLVISIGTRVYYAHRLAWLYMTGEWPERDVDHEDRNGLNNRWSNLREATRSQNNANRCVDSRNRFGLKGVRKSKNGKRFTTVVDGRYAGTFDTPDEAHAAYVAKAAEVFGEFARAA